MRMKREKRSFVCEYSHLRRGFCSRKAAALEDAVPGVSILEFVVFEAISGDRTEKNTRAWMHESGRARIV